jgi:hypothetical protein
LRVVTVFEVYVASLSQEKTLENQKSLNFSSLGYLDEPKDGQRLRALCLRKEQKTPGDERKQDLLSEKRVRGEDRRKKGLWAREKGRRFFYRSEI